MRGPNASQVAQEPELARWPTPTACCARTSSSPRRRRRAASILVTSANPGEGKTTTLANLAAALAQNGAKVLAVDADLRRPTLNQHFGLQKTPGLSDLIVGQGGGVAGDPVDAHQRPAAAGLRLPAAEPGGAARLADDEADPRRDPRPLRLGADRLAAAPRHGRRRRCSCSLVEGVVLVLAAEVATKPAVMRAIDQVQGVGGKVIGVVLNKVNLERNSYYYSQYYGEYYRSYYAEGATAGRAAAARPARKPAVAAAGAAGAAGLRRAAMRGERLYGRGPGALGLRGRCHAPRRRRPSRRSSSPSRRGTCAPPTATGTIQGVVRLEGRPLSGVTVAFIELQSGAVVRATSGEDGASRPRRPSGEYAVTTESQAGPHRRPGPGAGGGGRGQGGRPPTWSSWRSPRPCCRSPRRGARPRRRSRRRRRRAEGAGPRRGPAGARPAPVWAETIGHGRADPVRAGDLLRGRRVPAARRRRSSRSRPSPGRACTSRARPATPSTTSRWARTQGRYFGKLPRPRVEASPITYYVQSTTTRVRGEPDARDRGDRGEGQGRVRRPQDRGLRPAGSRHRLLGLDRRLDPRPRGLRGGRGVGPRGGRGHRARGRRGRRRRSWAASSWARAADGRGDAAADHRQPSPIPIPTPLPTASHAARRSPTSRVRPTRRGWLVCAGVGC